ncbi:MAG: molybdopterin biosynthesis protein [Gemmataceae bacterium]
MKQDQFLNVIDRDEAERRFHAALDLRPLPSETVALASALGRVLAQDVTAPVDVPSFDRSNVDGFALSAADTFGAAEETPRRVRLTPESLAPGQAPRHPITSGFATPIATGAMIPRGADAVVMIEHTDNDGAALIVFRPVAPGANISFAGTDIGRGEVVLRRGDLLTSRDTGVLAAIGLERVEVTRRPRVGILSTGDELIAPGAAMRAGLVFDSNAVILADAVRELGGEAVALGIFPDDRERLRSALEEALDCDVVLLSGGTSKGEGDVSYRAVADLGPPGVIAHGVALKPGKPLCLAATRRGERIVPVVILPGFPTSAIFTFHEFVAPVLLALGGRRRESGGMIRARLPMRVNSERGRTEYLLVGLVEAESGYIAYPMGKGSGSVTAFSRADGFIVIERQREYLEAGTEADVHLLGKELRPADLVVIGSHCVGLDYLLGRLQDRGLRTKFLAVGSTGGLEAARRGECDVAGIHLMDPRTGEYNRPFVAGLPLRLVEGYRRMQGIVFRRGDVRFEGQTAATAVANALGDPSCLMVNRNRGSGTRILLDRLLHGAQPAGYTVETRSHNAVAAAVEQGRADWGLAIETVARQSDLGFVAVQEERYDFVVPEGRVDRAAVASFLDELERPATRAGLLRLGFLP